jgi:hypothetical protein
MIKTFKKFNANGVKPQLYSPNPIKIFQKLAKQINIGVIFGKDYY